MLRPAPRARPPYPASAIHPGVAALQRVLVCLLERHRWRGLLRPGVEPPQSQISLARHNNFHKSRHSLLWLTILLLRLGLIAVVKMGFVDLKLEIFWWDR